MQLEPSLSPVLVWVKMGLGLELRPDLLPAICGGCFLICTRCLVHSLAVVEAMCVLLVDVGTVAVLEVDNVRVAFTSVAVVIVTTSEVVDVEVEVLLAA